MPYVLFIYLASWSAQGGMTVTTHEFGSEVACKSAASMVVEKFGGISTRVFWFCAPKDIEKKPTP